MQPGKIIPLTKSKTAIVDSEDYARLVSMPWPWRAKYAKGQWYAVTRFNGRDIGMHNLLMIAPPDYEIDHKNGNGLDNRRENLRIATHAQNMSNRKHQRNNTSGFRGVHWMTDRQKWRAQIRHNGAHIHIGVFISAEDGARAYDAKAQELFGEFARLNFSEKRARA